MSTPAEDIARKILDNYAGVFYADFLDHPDAFKRRERYVADAARMIEPDLLRIESRAVERVIMGGA